MDIEFKISLEHWPEHYQNSKMHKHTGKGKQRLNCLCRIRVVAKPYSKNEKLWTERLLHTANSVSLFKKCLKTHFFSSADLIFIVISDLDVFHCITCSYTLLDVDVTDVILAQLRNTDHTTTKLLDLSSSLVYRR